LKASDSLLLTDAPFPSRSSLDAAINSSKLIAWKKTKGADLSRSIAAVEEGGGSETNRPRPRTVTAFALRSVSIRLYPHNDLHPGDLIDELCEQANIALRSGFDGVMTSEHHGGFAGYMAQPLQMATFVLGQTSTGWVAAAPLLLPLRATALVAEEVAWLNARYPDRVGLGVAAGALPLDFDIAGIGRKEASPIFKAELPRLVAMLRGENLGELASDPALAACRRTPVPVLSAAVSVAAATRAAMCGAGILMEGMSNPDRLATLTQAFDRASGIGSKVLIRRVWLGGAETELIRRQRAVYDSYSGAATAFGDDQTIAANDPSEVVERLRGVIEATRIDALNLRVHLPGIPPHAIREQIELLGSQVVRPLKDRWPTSSSRATVV
jgi:alkanesulfonate monooxygenase SsuD/methylene tetrahydromethanopterin reductase-like flavin-dependent oxidoreductase (luciferase family)